MPVSQSGTHTDYIRPLNAVVLYGFLFPACFLVVFSYL